MCLEGIFLKLNNKLPIYSGSFKGILGEPKLSEETIINAEKEFTYIITPGKNSFKFLKVIKGENNDGFFINEIHDLTSNDINDFNNAYQLKVSNLSSDDVEFIHFGAIDNDQFRIQIGKSNETISMPQEQDKLKEIIDLITNAVKKHSKSKNIILTRDIFNRNLKTNDAMSLFTENDFKDFKSKRINPQKLMLELKKEFPDKCFYLGGNPEKDISALNSMPKVNSTSDITAFIAPKSLEVEYDLLSKKNVKRTFTESSIEVIDLDQPVIKSNKVGSKIKIGSNVIVITGNRDLKTELYLKKIREVTDLKDKIIVTFSCFTEGNDYTNTSYLEKTGANSIIYFPTKIHPDAVKEVLLEFSNSFKNYSESKFIREILEQSIEKAFLKETDSYLKQQIDNLRHFFQQTSFNNDQNQKVTISIS
jgi:hypothetical protein